MDGNPSSISFVQAKHFVPGGLSKPPLGLTIHDMEAPEKGGTAEAVASYFRNPSRVSSAHYCLDVDSIVQCVRDSDKAAHAPGVNSTHLGLEHAGYASQSEAEWRDPYSWAMLERSAAFARAKCDQYGIPKVLLSVADLKQGNVRGITTHARVSEAFRRSSHTDPGPNFPLVAYLNLVKGGAESVQPPKPAGFKLGDSGQGVAFLQHMMNILAPVRINAEGRAGGVQLKVNEKNPYYGPKTREAVAECQRFFDAMSRLSGGKGVRVTGIADPDTMGMIGFWVKQLLAGRK